MFAFKYIRKTTVKLHNDIKISNTQYIITLPFKTGESKIGVGWNETEYHVLESGGGL